MNMRIGQGFDLHRLETGRPFMLGGIQIESTVGPVGHSDGDVILHALTDALLGALALGDIGDWFPPSDPQWKDAKSELFLQKAIELITNKNYQLVNADITVVLETPKLGAFKKEIQQTLAGILSVDADCISIKAKTAEGILGELGKGDAVACFATVLLTSLK